MQRSFFIKCLILLVFFDCFCDVANVCKNAAQKILLSVCFYWVNIEVIQSDGNFEWGSEGGEGGGGKQKSTQHAQWKKTKRSQKMGVTFANVGTMLMTIYIYNIIYNII